MSVTTTTNARILTTANYLADYDLHHSQPSDSDSSPAPAPNQHNNSSSLSAGNPGSSASQSNPAGWETQWNRVPAHRPVQNQLDEQRNTYTSEIERNFVRVMFGGEFLLSFFLITSFLDRRLASHAVVGMFFSMTGGINFLLTMFV
jgi:hypothetical protein